ncbi:Proline rich antigen 2 [Phytophthora cinnamomi]|uniref:Proline rich antigen 2 n=1 Tax=Phytophthora cinnamomi TaxID=4785 RepID=UPI00355A9D08|nr:Proline rich antigen 2 [Phytophthora cinnamomi]
MEEMKKQAVKPSETTTTDERADGQEKEAATRDRVPGGGGSVPAPRVASVDVASEINDESSNGGMDAPSSPASEKNSESLIATSPHDETSRRNLAAEFDDGGLSDRSECFVDDGNGSMGSASDAEVEETKNGDATIALDDPNIRAPGEDVTGYAALDSGGESEGTSIIDEDEDLGAGEADYMVEDGGISSDVQFEPSLVEATAYCIRFEGYCGKRQTYDGSTPPDEKSDSYLDWHVAKHDVYGEQFCTSWEAADEDHEDMDDFNLDELHDALDDAALIDE